MKKKFVFLRTLWRWYPWWITCVQGCPCNSSQDSSFDWTRYHHFRNIGLRWLKQMWRKFSLCVLVRSLKYYFHAYNTNKLKLKQTNKQITELNHTHTYQKLSIWRLWTNPCREVQLYRQRGWAGYKRHHPTLGDTLPRNNFFLINVLYLKIFIIINKSTLLVDMTAKNHKSVYDLTQARQTWHQFKVWE